MGRNTKIPWATHTFNPWWGCAKIPDRRGCDRCYAESFAKRTGKNVWGHDAERRIASESVWKNPLQWNAEAAESGARPMVFCMSMGDFLEDRPELVQPRNRAIRIIKETQYLDWLILTKRIKNSYLLPWKPGEFPSYVRMGITVENQAVADRDIPNLLALRCKSFISVEPMLDAIDLDPAICPYCQQRSDSLADDGATPWCCECGSECGYGNWRLDFTDEQTGKSANGGIDWVICGAESAPGKRLGRPINLDWVRSLRDQCVDAGTSFFYKQGPSHGELVELPLLDGHVWNQVPGARSTK